MSKAQQLMARDQLAAVSQEEARRKRAEMRRSYGNKFSSINLNRMRQKQSASSNSVGTYKNVPVEAPPKDKDESLRRIASSFAHVRDLVNGSCAALPPEDSEDDAREERAEVLISSQTMPLPPEASPDDPVEMPVDWSPKEQEVISAKPSNETLSEPSSPFKLSKIMPDPLPVESRAFDRWQQLGSTVSALFRARRHINSLESPVAQTRRLREQRELLEVFTRPFLYEAYKRE
ncbi:uncharacterized protein [Drosophila takahashii]|uniref:uncharacterized protein n=1 Tax=Drosophila takahashii TaxID=29030 RepID=UPI001CF88B0A|nr:uncharacterized protein LOC108065661 [Drosophila takahashii]